MTPVLISSCWAGLMPPFPELSQPDSKAGGSVGAHVTALKWLRSRHHLAGGLADVVEDAYGGWLLTALHSLGATLQNQGNQMS